MLSGTGVAIPSGRYLPKVLGNVKECNCNIIKEDFDGVAYTDCRNLI